MSKRILLIVGHPAKGSYCELLADAYGNGATAAGHEVRRIHLGALDFDPVLHNGYSSAQELEPDLQEAQKALSWAQHLVFAYPLWWGGLPALLKGFIDRVFLPGFAFSYRNGYQYWDRLLSGRSAQLLVTMDTPPWYYRWVYRMPAHHQMRRTILEFCGVAPVAIADFGPIKSSSSRQREKWFAQAYSQGKSA